MKRLLQLLATQNRAVSFVASAAATIALIASVRLATEFPRWIENPPAGMSDRGVVALGIGTIFFLVASLRSLSRALLDSFWKEDRITAGLGIHDSPYGYLKLIDNKCDRIVITGHNLRNLLDAGLAQKLTTLLKQNAAATVIIICTPYKILKAISDVGAADLLSSVTDLEELLGTLSEDQRSRVKVFLHPGAVSLSCLVRDPEKKRRAVVVVTPRWATDRIAPRRLFCVIEKREHRDLFEAIYRGIEYPESECQSLDKFVAGLGSAKHSCIPVPSARLRVGHKFSCPECSCNFEITGQAWEYRSVGGVSGDNVGGSRGDTE